MKKKIGFVSMDSVLAQWLLEKLIQEPPERKSIQKTTLIYYIVYHAIGKNTNNIQD